jgi:biotin carboxyl carrier protein
MTTGMNNAQVRIIDPVLSSVAHGYSNNEFVGHRLFPRIPVGQRGGQVLEFGKEAFRAYNLRRAPGGPTKRIQYGYLGKAFALFQDAAEAVVPIEHMSEAAVAQPGIDLSAGAVRLTMDVTLKALEFEQATIATSVGNYDNNHKVTLSGGDKWSADTGNPTKDIAAGKEAVRATTGKRANVCILSAQAYEAARNNPKVIEHFNKTTNDPVTAAMLAKLWEVDVAVGDAITADDDDVFTDIWGNNVVLAYVPTANLSQGQPSYGYTYTLNGHPMVEQGYYDRNTKSWVHGVTMERAPVLTGMGAGFLIQNPK